MFKKEERIMAKLISEERGVYSDEEDASIDFWTMEDYVFFNDEGFLEIDAVKYPISAEKVIAKNIGDKIKIATWKATDYNNDLMILEVVGKKEVDTIEPKEHYEDSEIIAYGNGSVRFERDIEGNIIPMIGSFDGGDYLVVHVKSTNTSYAWSETKDDTVDFSKKVGGVFTHPTFRRGYVTFNS